jgi:hypothetical protein
LVVNQFGSSFSRSDGRGQRPDMIRDAYTVAGLPVCYFARWARLALATEAAGRIIIP